MECERSFDVSAVALCLNAFLEDGWDLESERRGLRQPLYRNIPGYLLFLALRRCLSHPRTTHSLSKHLVRLMSRGEIIPGTPSRSWQGVATIPKAASVTKRSHQRRMRLALPPERNPYTD